MAAPDPLHALSKASQRALAGVAASRGLSGTLRRVPGVPALVRRQAAGRVAGATLAEASATAHRLLASGVGVVLNHVGEDARTPAEVERALSADLEAAAELGRLLATPALAATGRRSGVHLGIDPSSLGVDLDLTACRHHIHRLCGLLPPGMRVEVSAEQSRRWPAILQLVLDLAGDGAPIIATLQANLHRAPEDARRLAAAAVPVRLVKGAYVEGRRIAHDRGAATDAAYLDLVRLLAGADLPVVLATHDSVLRARALAVAPDAVVEQLLGVQADQLPGLVAAGTRVRVEVPYGFQWFRFALRRLAES